MATPGTVHVERVADCPFSIAQEYAEEHLRDAERGGDESIVYAGPFRRRVTFSFGTQSDDSEPGRAHDEITLTWHAGTTWLPDFKGSLRMRIASPRTLLILDGTYVPPGGALGAFFDALIGNRIATGTAASLLAAIAQALTDRERAWRAQTTA
jgi:hypothetical protein